VHPQVGDDAAIGLLMQAAGLGGEVVVALIVVGGPVEALKVLDARLDVGGAFGVGQRRVLSRPSAISQGEPSCSVHDFQRRGSMSSGMASAPIRSSTDSSTLAIIWLRS